MIFTLEVLPAQEGDCLLLHYGTAAKPRLAVIDGGPGRVYEDSLLPRLEEIRKHRNLALLDLDLVMVSHVDNDHIVGVKKLFADVQNNAVPIRPRRLWHNTFNDVVGDSNDAYYGTLASSVTASANGSAAHSSVAKTIEQRLKANGAKEAAESAREIASILAGHGEGRSLRDSYSAIRQANPGALSPLNSPFGMNGKTTLITDVAAIATVNELSVQVVGPSNLEIVALQKKFDAYLKKYGLMTASILAAYADESVTNLSSIVCLVKAGKQSMLFTGDARGDRILAGLKKAKLYSAKKPLRVGVLKVPHHGSSRNAEKDLFENIIADTYVFSGNGKHGNPDRTTLQMLFDARDAKDVYEVVLTYAVADIDAERNKDFQKRKKIWKTPRDSIEALLKERRAAGFKFKLVAGAPAKIELGDGIGW